MTKEKLIEKYQSRLENAIKYRDYNKDLANTNYSCRNISNGDAYAENEGNWERIVMYCEEILEDLKSI